MEGGLSFIDNNDNNTVLNNDAKSRTDEFKQMLGDNRLGNELIMNDIINDMMDKSDNEYEDEDDTNSDIMHITLGGPVVSDENSNGEGVGFGMDNDE